MQPLLIPQIFSQDGQKVEQFIDSIQHLTFPQKYQQFHQKVTKLEQENSPLLIDYYKAFCEEFPFNHTNWNKYAYYIARQKNDNAEGLKVFNRGADLNGCSVEFWNCFCFWAKNSYPDRPDIVKDVYIKSVKNIGYDYFSGTFWQEVFKLEKDPDTLFDYYCQVVSIPMNSISEIFKQFTTFLETQNLIQVRKYFTKLSEGEVDNNSSLPELSSKVSSIWTNIYSKTLIQQKEKQNFESKIKYSEYDTNAVLDLDFWKQYLLNDQKEFSKEQFLFVFRKCLISQCGQGDLWLKYFDQHTEEQVEKILNKYSKFFTTLGGEAFNYMIDFYEMKGYIDKVKDLLIKQQKSQPAVFTPYMRLIQLEMRRNNYVYVEDQFQNLEIKFAQHIDTLAFIVNEKAQYFALKKKKIQQGLDSLLYAFEKYNFQKQILAFMLKYLIQHYDIDKVQILFEDVIVTNLIKCQEAKKLHVDLITMCKQFIRQYYKNTLEILKTDRILRTILFPLGSDIQKEFNQNKRKNPESQNENGIEVLEKQIKTN